MTMNLPAMSLLYGACALIYAGLTVLILARKPRSATGLWLALACAMTALWAGSVATRWLPGTIAAWLELVRSVAWYGFILHLYRRSVAAHRQLLHAFRTMGLLAVVLIGGLMLANVLSTSQGRSLWAVGTALQFGFPVASILLLENLYFNTPIDKRWHINLLCIALGGIFLYDLVLYSDAILFRRVSLSLLEGRAPVVAMAAPLIALTAARNRRWRIDIHVSRDVVFHSASLIIAGVFLLALAVAGEIFRRSSGGGNWGHVAETTLIFGGIMAVAVLLTSGSVRSRLRIFLVDHFFSYRYDYRREWIRCIETLTAPDAHIGLHLRAIRAAAEVVDSPAGVLFVRAPEEVSFQWAGSWNMPALTMPIPPGHPIVTAFRDGDWIAVFDEIPEADGWFPDLPRTWLAVPLNHFGTVIGFVVLARSRAQFKLDREAFDLLRVVGREIASRVAEQRAAQILSQTRQLREYSQRFAFVIHDIKNVSGQLSMLLSNAEVHADNPEFQRDMLATVRASVSKITRLLTRLQAEQQERSHALITPVERLQALVDVCRATRHAQIALDDDDAEIGVAIDPEAFDAVVTHLLNNAVEASGPGKTVTVTARREGLSLVVDITDQGPGMPPEFVRDRLFQPFTTTKASGHGIGAYQARELLRNAGGDLLVHSREDIGTTMTILLPAVGVALTDATAA
ncbi:MAG: XrtA/PEP-CTERM system histidine kinase PrsK [Acetobacteraceae bacterium]